MATIFESARDFFTEARKKTPAITGPIDAQGKPITQPDITGIADAGTIFTTSQPGQSIKDTTRRGRYSDFDLMDSGDIASLLTAVVDSALTFEDGGDQCFRLDGTKSNAKAILETTIGITDLRAKVRTIAHDLVKYGDGFLETLEGDGGIVSRVQTYYPGQVFVIIDQKGTILGYQQNNISQQAVGEWQPGELVHFKWDASDREPYSKTSLLDGLRADWKNLTTLENGMILGRTSRAYPRNLHFIDVTNKSTVEANKSIMGYIRAITRQNPVFNYNGSSAITRTDLQPNEDIFIPTGYVQGNNGQMEKRLHDVKMLDPNMNGLQNIADVEYVRRKMFGTVPAEIVGIGQVDLDTAAQYRSYARTVKKLQAALEHGLREMFTQIMVMSGIAPDTLEFIWPNIISGENWKFQDAKYKQAMTEQIEIDSKKHSRRFFMRLEGMTDADIDAEFAEIKAEQDVFSVIPAPQVNPDGTPSDPNKPDGLGSGPDTGKSKASQAAAGGKSGNSVLTPNVSDKPNTAKNSAAQPSLGKT